MECKEGIVLTFRSFQFCINRNIMECKVRNFPRIRSGQDPRINRNIMECKEVLINGGTLDGYRINRNIMECKVFQEYVLHISCVVLIETLWNVKQYMAT